MLVLVNNKQPNNKNMPKSTSLPSIQLSGIQLSDLFFNSELTNYNRACKIDKDDESIGDWKQRRNEAIHLDAIDFAKHTGNQVDAVDLVRDFLNRL